ncbi:hypothetical protein M431DRAFT_12403 [Trichoderma harzianum CBS 226.95]|uniref:Uncharacterized protein n=1 Tax=Trichoderma harzianum CBS 226.95 TaxID=983964 RepID=A0A2T4ATT4_TRIHA|nr:hypothetical protein M431DRAFT_12403 [Trichoderma harzianum CBS 226.95]PTB60475.1 hypothetical protein M431DRAFT_12403 [Trichoderma harzianum CBS 226.95]
MAVARTSLLSSPLLSSSLKPTFKLVLVLYFNMFIVTNVFLFYRGLLVTFVVAHNTLENTLCKPYNCGACAASLEAAAVHHGCYGFFTHRCLIDDTQVLLRRLLVLALWKRPWKEAQPLFLPNSNDSRSLDVAANMYGLPQLSRLPVDLLKIIHGHSAGALFWRSISVLRATVCISNMGDESQQSEVVALRHVVSWKRGGKLDKSDSQTPLIIRLTIDSDGISRVERLVDYPRYWRKNYRYTAHIVGSGKDVEGVQVELVNGLLRLKLLPNGWVPHIWNTPVPPPLSRCNLSPNKPSATWPRLFYLESESMRGITFFYTLGRLCDIHIHYQEQTSARSTHRRMKRAAQSNAIWLYLPIPPGDQLTVVGLRQQPGLPFCYLFQLKKSGDVIIGPHGNSFFKDSCLGAGTSLGFIYGEPNRADFMPQQVELIGAYCRPESQPTPEWWSPHVFPLDRYEAPLDRFGANFLSQDSFLQAEYFSWAPLDDVVSALVFRDQITGCCKGILFFYRNGGCRAIGECRLHVDPAQTVPEPSQLCYQMESHPAKYSPDLSVYRARVTVQPSSQHERVHLQHTHGKIVDEGWVVHTEWKCYLMHSI